MSTRGTGMLGAALILAACASAPSAAPDAPARTPNARRDERGDAIRALAIGHQRACAVRADGRVVCWGGCFTCYDDPPPPEPTLVPALDDAIAISGDDSRWCVVERGGTVACWTGTEPASQVAGVRGAVEVANTCARLADGTVTCWGTVPTLPDGPLPITRLAQGYGSVCGIRANGGLVCWSNVYPYPTGQPLYEDAPVEFTAPRDVELVATSAMRGTCTKSRGRNVECWGGEAAFAPESSIVEGTSDAIALALAEYHGCVLKRDGRVACWGFNFAGQLGAPRDVLEERWDARPIEGLTAAVAVATGSGEPSSGTGSTCVITRDARVICWGNLADVPGGVLDLTPR
ncbi:MAG: RCC1 domain-containing protein [Polyangiaceae bacterium]